MLRKSVPVYLRCFAFVMLMTVALLTGCQNTQSKQAGDNTILREPDRGNPVHGEVGAVYGHSG